MNLKFVRRMINDGKIRVLPHAAKRMIQRGYNLLEIQHVIKSGFHEKHRDEFDLKYDVWNHCFRGRTQDGKDTRVVFSVIDEIIVVTVVGPF